MIFRVCALFRMALVVACFSTAAGCAIFKREKKQEAAAAEERDAQKPAMSRSGPLRMGTITLVNETEHFVLIDTGLGVLPAIGTALKSFSGEQLSGIVTVGNVNRRPFVVADIVQGSPRKGDGVFQ